MGVLNEIVVRNGHSVSSAELSRATGHDETLIVRLMRLLTARGTCRESGIKTYCSNAVADALNSPGQVGAVKNMSVLYDHQMTLHLLTHTTL